MSAPPTLAAQDWLRAAPLRRLFAAFPPGSLRCVGGCIRDSLAGLPVKDIDLATPLSPDAVMARLRAARIAAVPTGIRHGTVTAVIRHRPYEITTLRHDVETDGRHATVAFIDDWEADAARRDLTINAIYCDADGTLFDPFGGADDLAAGRVRFVGDAHARITEDYLRLMRFFRFHARYGRGAPDAEALAAARALAPGLARLSAERVHDELMKLLAGPRADAVLALMAANGILPHVDPAVRDVDRLARLVAAETLAAGQLPGVRPDAVRRLAALLGDGAGAGADGIGQRLRLSNKEIKRVGRALALRPAMSPTHERRTRRLLIYELGAETYRDRCLLRWASAPAEGTAEAWIVQLAEAESWQQPQFPLGGADVLDLGVATGPRVGRLLDAVRDWWRDGGFVADRESCLAELRARAALPDGRKLRG
ncbi:MAG: CCA tRNA nucleotidyltransferase [Alphaproteobacteria bacterium]